MSVMEVIRNVWMYFERLTVYCAYAQNPNWLLIGPWCASSSRGSVLTTSHVWFLLLSPWMLSCVSNLFTNVMSSEKSSQNTLLNTPTSFIFSLPWYLSLHNTYYYPSLYYLFINSLSPLSEHKHKRKYILK